MPYIVIEGVDFSGKSTLITALKTQLKLQYGVESVIVEEPSVHSERCREIRRLVTTDKTLTNEQRMELFIEQRVLVIKELVLPALAEGKLVIGSRNFVSTMVYQTPLNGFGMQAVLNANLEALEPLGDNAIPSYGILCEISHETFLKRCSAREGYLDELEKPLLNPGYFHTWCEKYKKAMMYARVNLPQFEITSYSTNFELLLTSIASKYGYELPKQESAEMSGLTPPQPAVA